MSRKNHNDQWIFLRGLGREARHWLEFPEVFEAAFATEGQRIRLDSIDLPGTGKFSEMKSPISIFGITEFARSKFVEIRQRQREAGIEPAKRTFLLAVSLGGMVANEWLRHWPDDFKGSVLINTSFSGFSPFHHRLQPRAMLQLSRIARQKEAVAREEEILRMVSNRPEQYRSRAEKFVAIQDSRPLSTENFARQLIAAARFRPGDFVPAQPVLVLNSANDHMVNPRCSVEIARRWDADLHTHPNAGHDLTLDDPKWVANEALAWWKDLID